MTDRDAAPAAALCNPCREGTPKEGCETCSALAAMIVATVEQYFPAADPSTVQVHMAGTPPWEREGWEDELDAAPAAAEGADDYRLYGYCGEYVAAVAARMAFTDDERERWQPLIESAYLAGWNTALAARPAPAAAPREGAHQDAQEGQQTPSPAGVASVPAVDAAAVLSRETLARRVALLEGLLREVQHHAHWGTCSVCGWHRDHGHTPDCRLAVALADGG